MPLKDNLARETVAKLDLRPALTVNREESVSSVVAKMRESRTGCALVEEDGRLVGIFTERDYLKRVLARRGDLKANVGTVMSPDPTNARTDESIGSVLIKFRDGGYRHLPVVDARMRPLGVVSVRELVHYMVEHFPKAVYNLPPSPDQLPTAPDGA